jgi:hypothetical protein
MAIKKMNQILAVEKTSAVEAFPAAKPLLRRAASRGSQPAIGVGFPHPNARQRVRAGRPSKRGNIVREAGDVVAARRGLQRAGDQLRLLFPASLCLSEPPGFIPGEV